MIEGKNSSKILRSWCVAQFKDNSCIDSFNIDLTLFPSKIEVLFISLEDGMNLFQKVSNYRNLVGIKLLGLLELNKTTLKVRPKTDIFDLFFRQILITKDAVVILCVKFWKVFNDVSSSLDYRSMLKFERHWKFNGFFLRKHHVRIGALNVDKFKSVLDFADKKFRVKVLTVNTIILMVTSDLRLPFEWVFFDNLIFE